jgi:hypothetical protein
LHNDDWGIGPFWLEVASLQIVPNAGSDKIAKLPGEFLSPRRAENGEAARY